MNLAQIKRCTKCGEKKPFYNFELRNDTGYFRTVCKQCKNLNDASRSNQKYKSDPEYRERRNQQTRDWKRQQSATNPEYRARHRNRQAEYAQTPEGILGAFRRDAEYRCRGEFVYVPFTYKELQERMNAFDGRCAYCDRKVKLVRDHFIPFARGGHHAIYNIVPCCERCNVSKGDNAFHSWYIKQPFYRSFDRYVKICEMCDKYFYSRYLASLEDASTVGYDED